jgi:hypothetical protein
VRIFAIALVIAGGCSSKTSAPTVETPPVADKPPPPAAAAWTIESTPITVDCGKLPPPSGTLAPEATLKRAAPMEVCQSEASVAAACTCLGTKLGPKPGECKPRDEKGPSAQLVEISGDDGARALVLVGKRGATWTALGIVASAAGYDPDTPKMSSRATVERFEAKPLADGTLYWIESQEHTQEKAVGDLDETGEVRGTICVIRNDNGYCFEPIELGSWDSTTSNSACTLRHFAAVGARITANSVAVQLVHGVAPDKLAGKYKF